MAKSNKLTVVFIKNLRKPGRYCDGSNGLHLIVDEAKNKRWVCRLTVHGRRRDIGLGPLALTSLVEAREQALAMRKAVREGRDPIAERKAKRTTTPTFDECAAEFITSHEQGWHHPKHIQQWRNSLKTYASPIFGQTPISIADTELVLKVLSPLWSLKPETASRLRGRIESILDWAKVKGYRSGENPARWKGHLDQLLPKLPKSTRVKHHPALPYQQISTMMAALRKIDIVQSLCLQFLVLTATRSSEGRGALWQEIDWDAKLWVIPASRMKGGKREHPVPLTPAAIEVLNKARALNLDNNDLVFAGSRPGRPISDTAINKLLRQIGYKTIHGMRAAFHTYMSEETQFENIVVDMCLSHHIKGVEVAYRRGQLIERRRECMASWAKYCIG